MRDLSTLLKTIDNPNDKVIPHIKSMDYFYSKVKSPMMLNNIETDQDYISKAIDLICNTNNNNSIIASCECGNLNSEYYVGTICPKCNTKVVQSIINNIENEIWFEIPEVIDYVLHPRIYSVLSYWLESKSNESYLNDILDVTRDLPEEFEGYIDGQGFNYLYRNFDYVMNFFLNIFPKTKIKSNNNLIKVFIEKHKEIMWCRKLPILSKYLQSVTKNGYSLQYADKSLKSLLKAVNQFLMYKLTKIINSSNKQIEKTLWKIYFNYNEYYKDIIINKLNPKRGYFRKNVFGSRLHFTSRAVAIPTVEVSMHDEICVSWKSGLNNFKFHIINILTNRFGLKVYVAYDKVMKAFYSYDPIIDQIFQLLILESRFKGFPVLINRNPSLLLSNILLNFIVKVKPQLTNISKEFIRRYGRNIDINNISSEIKYKNNIYTKRANIVDRNRFDSKEFVNYYMTKEYSFDNIETTKFGISMEEIKNSNNALIDYTVSVSYIIVGLMNLDFDGDSLNMENLLPEMDIVERIVDRLHPCNFFFDNDKMEISSKMSIPNQHLLLLNAYLEDK